MKIPIPILILALSLAITPTLAAQVQATPYCINSTWLGDNITLNIGGNTVPVYTAEPCSYGCDSVQRECKQSQWSFLLGPLGNLGLLGLVLVIVIMFIAVTKMR